MSSSGSGLGGDKASSLPAAEKADASGAPSNPEQLGNPQLVAASPAAAANTASPGNPAPLAAPPAAAPLAQALAHAGLPQVLSPLATLVTGHLASPAHEFQLEPQAEGKWVATAAGITALIAAAGFRRCPNPIRCLAPEPFECYTPLEQIRPDSCVGAQGTNQEAEPGRQH